MSPAVAAVESASKPVSTPLHAACMYGELETVELLLKSTKARKWIEGSDSEGRRPVHVVLSTRSAPNTFSCLAYLLAHGANVNVYTLATNSGLTPLHLAASEDLLDCLQALLKAGADASAKDGAGLTPLDLARVWCNRKVARCLRNGLWWQGKEKEMRERKLVQTLYSDLVCTVNLNGYDNKTLPALKRAPRAKKTSLPVLKDKSHRVSRSHHTQFPVSLQDSSHPKQAKRPLKRWPHVPLKTKSTRRPPASPPRPWTIFSGFQSEESLKDPDLRDKVAVWRDDGSRQHQYATAWDSTRRPTPDVSLDILERVLFPRDFPSRITPPFYYKTHGIVEVQHKGQPEGRSTSPWTEVAMHLAEVLEPGHY